MSATCGPIKAESGCTVTRPAASETLAAIIKAVSELEAIEVGIRERLLGASVPPSDCQRLSDRSGPCVISQIEDVKGRLESLNESLDRITAALGEY